MKLLTNAEANSYLAPLGMKIGNWNEVSNRSVEQIDQWTNYKAPLASRELLNFCYRVASWLPRSDWKLIQIDNSTYLDPAQKLVLSTLLSAKNHDSFGEPGSYLLEFEKDDLDANSLEIILAHVIYFIIVFEAHCYIVASRGNQQQRLGIQDGFIYFVSAASDFSGAAEILKGYEQEPEKLPDWVARMNVSSAVGGTKAP